MLAEGAKIETIDRALTEFGFPVGPITLIDEVGIDVGLHVLETMAASFGDRIGVPSGIKTILDKGKLGRKNKNGFYRYENDKKAGVDESIYSIVGVQAGSSKLTQKEMCDRAVMVFLNESVRCLEEKILNQPYDGDVGAVFGLGFPPFCGGPFHYIDFLGVSTVVAKLESLAAVHGKRFVPAELLKKMAKEQTRFF
jgi:3-hydroxyacyl-CoA dehydrogenase/enoyl-CoA hydratase/3-hydroxybutyryl-CoA epimerase